LSAAGLDNMGDEFELVDVRHAEVLFSISVGVTTMGNRDRLIGPSMRGGAPGA